MKLSVIFDKVVMTAFRYFMLMEALSYFRKKEMKIFLYFVIEVMCFILDKQVMKEFRYFIREAVNLVSYFLKEGNKKAVQYFVQKEECKL